MKYIRGIEPPRGMKNITNNWLEIKSFSAKSWNAMYYLQPNLSKCIASVRTPFDTFRPVMK